jgi:endonuclease YncB( thermonuclease family)
MKMGLLIAILIFTVPDYFQTTENVTVERVVDGDTFVTSDNKRVRLIGIDAPELKDKFGRTSKEQLETLILGKEIQLKSDPLTNDTDIYDRLLRYVYVDDTDINRLMIEKGYANAYLKFKFSKSQEYSETQNIARTKELGIWSIESNQENNDEERIYYQDKKTVMIVIIWVHFKLSRFCKFK